MRHRKLGDWYVIDQESGFKHWRSDCVKRWDGVIVHKKNNEDRHPSLFARPAPRTYSLDLVSPDFAVTVTAIAFPYSSIQGLNVWGPATHLFPAGIGTMVIESDNATLCFIIR